MLVDERVINKGFGDKGVGLPVYRSACLPVKIVVSRQYLVFSKEKARIKEETISPNLNPPPFKGEEKKESNPYILVDRRDTFAKAGIRLSFTFFDKFSLF